MNAFQPDVEMVVVVGLGVDVGEKVTTSDTTRCEGGVVNGCGK